MRDPRTLATAARVGLTAAALIPGGVVGAAVAGAAMFGRSRSSSGTFSPSSPEDQQLVESMRGEFDILPRMPNEEAARYYLRHDHTNLSFIGAPGPHAGTHADTAFFRELTERRWSGAATPTGAQARILGAQRTRTDAGQQPRLFKPATDWADMNRLKRVNAYTFRGDRRAPALVRTHGGFQPSAQRTDDGFVEVLATEFVGYMKQKGKTVDEAEVARYIRGQGQRGADFTEYHRFRALMQSETMHIGRMAKSEVLKGYVSSSRNPRVAVDYARRANRDDYTWIYVTHVEGGFLLPEGQTTNPHGGTHGEAEIALPGPIQWSRIVAAVRLYVDVYQGLAETEVVLVRPSLRGGDQGVFLPIYAALSIWAGNPFTVNQLTA